MKILHTSDWHLGKKLDNFSRHPEQIDVLNEICEIADNKQVDLILIAGDIFDAYNPPVESIELFYKTIKRLCKNGQRPVIAIAGNHDSPDRIEAPDALALEDAIILAGNPNCLVRNFKNSEGIELLNSEVGFIELKLSQLDYPVRIIINPYANQFRLKKFLGLEDAEEELRQVLENYWNNLANKYLDNKGVNLFCGHLFFIEENGIIPEEPEDEKPIYLGTAQAIFSRNLPNEMQYAALGHLHRKQMISKNPCPLVYCGSPIAHSFSEAGQKKYVSVIELIPGQKAVIEDVELSKGKELVRKKFDDIGLALEWLSQNREKLVELTIVSEEYLSAENRKKLNNSHENIISIIPELKGVKHQQVETKNIDLSKSMNSLFIDYFKSKHQQEPGSDILNILNEIVSQDDEEASGLK